jgi:hypothetical protein
MNRPPLDWQDVAVQRERVMRDLSAPVPTHFHLSVGWLLLAYVLGLLTVIGVLWWGYQ